MSQVNILKDKIAIITGAGRGLGEATAVRLARDGADIVVNDLNDESARATAKIIEGLGRKALISTHDVSKYDQAHALTSEVQTKFGRIDILVNNAGILRDSMLHKMTETQWDEVISVNLKGPFNMGQACAKVMITQKYGKILNLASVAWLGNIGQSNYSAAKAGVVGLTRTWAAELARHNINVNAIAPGLIETKMTAQIPAEVKEKFLARIPMHRMGKPEEIGSLISFLVSDQAAYITGQTLQIDGGLSVGIGGM